MTTIESPIFLSKSSSPVTFASISDAKVEAFNDNGKLALKADIDSPDDIDSQYLYTYKITL